MTKLKTVNGKTPRKGKFKRFMRKLGKTLRILKKSPIVEEKTSIKPLEKEKPTIPDSFFYKSVNPNSYFCKKWKGELRSAYRWGKADDLWVGYRRMTLNEIIMIYIHGSLPIGGLIFGRNDEYVDKEMCDKIKGIILQLAREFAENGNEKDARGIINTYNCPEADKIRRIIGVEVVEKILRNLYSEQAEEKAKEWGLTREDIQDAAVRAAAFNSRQGHIKLSEAILREYGLK